MESKIGIVIIGRNEGERLKTCFYSILNTASAIVYVDSGSTDNSVELAQSLKIAAINLDMSIPFSAARARNTGFNWLCQSNPDIDFVQFVDGDCEMMDGWLQNGVRELTNSKNLAIVYGHCKERNPDQSIYNFLCDIEWNTPIGEAEASGGNFLIRTPAFREINGFNPNVIAGEEPEMCFRLRSNNWKIAKIDFPMVMHDANITRFSQWWKRAKRCGYAYAHGFKMHGKSPEKYCFRESLRIWIWALIFPVVFLVFGCLSPALFCLFLLYPIQFFRISRKEYRRMLSRRSANYYALSVLISKWPELLGQIQFLNNNLFRKPHKIIEYKS